MPMILNKGLCMLSATTPCTFSEPDRSGRQKITEPGVHYNFKPGDLVSVSTRDLKALKKIPLIDESFENGVLVSGSSAKSIAAQDEKQKTSEDEADESTGEE